MTLRLPGTPGEDDPTESLRRLAAEQDATTRILAEMRRQMASLADAGEEPAAIRAAIEALGGDPSMTEVLNYVLQQGTDLGVSIAVDQFASAGISFDYGLVNEEAQRWARSYSFELVRGIEATTQSVARDELAAWMGTGRPYGDLVSRLEPLFGRERAKLIATTEITRAYAEGSIKTYQASGVVIGAEWLTARDAKVCKICEPLEGVRATLSGGWAGILRPPAHPGCRCAVAPVVPTPEELEAGIARGIYDVRFLGETSVPTSTQRMFEQPPAAA